MDRTEFLAVLEESLRGELPEYEIQGHIQYYDGYLREDNGKTEEEKFRELGDPRLIAKTILEASATKNGGAGHESSYENTYESRDYTKEQYSGQGETHYKVYSWDKLAWYQKVLVIVVIALIIVALVGLASVGIKIFVSVVLPVLVVLFLIQLVISFFR